MIESIKYIVDKSGKRKEVVIPIEMWNKLKNTKQLKDKNRMNLSTLRNYTGKIKLTVDPLEYQKRIRNEWS